MAIKNGRFQYPDPEDNWAVGKMRKRGDYAAMKQSRGVTDYSLNAEIERAAGMGIGGRGAASRAEVTKGAQGLSPDVIQQRKAVTEAAGQPWQVGKGGRQKERKERDLEGLGAYDLMDMAAMPVEMITGKRASEWSEDIFEALFSNRGRRGKESGAKEVAGYDKNFDFSMIPIEDWNPKEQASRYIKHVNKNVSIPLGKKKPAAAEANEGWEE